MGDLGSYMARRISSEVEKRGVLVWWDPDRSWEAWVRQVVGRDAEADEAAIDSVELSGLPVRLVQFGGSYVEVADNCDALLGEQPQPNLLVYIAGERHVEELSPVRELECYGGDRTAFLQDLDRTARQAFKSAGLPDARIDELLKSDSLTFEYLDGFQAGGADDASPLAPIFGSGREEDVFVGFLADGRRRGEVAERGLLGVVLDLANRSFGISIAEPGEADGLARKLARVILIAELRADLSAPEPVETTQVPRMATEEAVSRARGICRRLRTLEPREYVHLASAVEDELGLSSADIDPLALGSIDTFSFEERALLARCAEMIAEGQTETAQRLVEERGSSFWTSLDRFPDRRAEWQLLGDLVELARLDQEIEQELSVEPSSVEDWLSAYTSREGWHRADRLFRHVRSRLTRLDDTAQLESAANPVLTAHDELVDRMGRLFIARLEQDDWDVRGALRQREIFDEHVRAQGGPVAVILADALRFEMGSELARVLESSGATDLQLQPAVAEIPTITRVGMAALLPGATRSFEISHDDAGVHGVVGGTAARSVRDRMEHAKAEVPGLVETTLDKLVYELTRKKARELVGGAPVILVRSTEIDAAGEVLPSGLARRVMGSVLEDIRKAVLRLAEAGVSRFLVVSDHGHLFSFRRGDEMTIEAPSGGQKIDLHRRCWIGRGANTPSACVRVSLRDLGYTSELDLITPRGAAVFLSGGDRAYHHGGLSLQELVVPALSFDLALGGDEKAASSGIALQPAADRVTNRIFSLTVQRTELALEPLRLKVLAIGPDGRMAGQAMHATAGWDPESRVLSLGDEGPVSVAIQLDDDTVEELRVVAVEVGTDRTVKDTEPLPVQLLR